MKIEAPCKLDFYPAFHQSGLRPTSEIRWIVLHDEEAPTARGAASYFTSPSSGGSAHLCVDNTECYRCLPNTAIPWGAASAQQISANYRGFHIEMAGYAAWSAEEWEKHLNELKRAAYKTAIHCKAFKVPVVFVTAAGLPGKRGITTHNEVSMASKRLDPEHAWRYTHTDPGPNFPRAHFMALTKAYFAKL